MIKSKIQCSLLLLTTFSLSPTAVYAEIVEIGEDEIPKNIKNEQNINENEIKDVIIIQATMDDIIKPQVITSEQIRTGTIGNGNVTDLLRSSPAVQTSNGGLAGNQQGEIKPSKISIRGANSYQNNFLLDGISFNNDFDPSESGLGVTETTINSSEQGYYIDSRLIDNVKVYDNNIPVEYVVLLEVSLISPVSVGVIIMVVVFFIVQLVQVGTKYISIPVLILVLPITMPVDQVVFNLIIKKQNFGGWFEAGITDTLGIIFSASHRESDISALKYQGIVLSLDQNNDIVLTNKAGSGFKNQTRDADNYSSKLSWYMTQDTNADLSINYSKHKDYSFSSRIANSGMQTDHSGIGGMFEITSNFDIAELKLNAGYQQLQDDRTSDQNYYLGFKDSTDWRNIKEYGSGGVGSLNTTQKNTNLKSKLTFRPVEFASMIHEPKIGLEYAKTKAIYKRDEDYFRYTFNYSDGDGYWSSSVFEKGTHSASYDNYAFYLDDTITYQRLTLRPGVRIDYDDFVKEANIAPRLTASYDLFGTGQTNVIAGYNRYYGRNMMVYALYGAQNAGLKNCYYGSCAPGDPVNSDWSPRTDFEGLNSLSTPYSNEYTFAVEQTILDTLWKFQYVHRDGKNEVISRNVGSRYSEIKEFDNSGESTHDSFSISVSNPEPWHLGITDHTITSSIVWEKNKSNTPKNGYADYDSSTRINREYVYYDGKVIKASKLPATDFNLPLRFNFEIRTDIPDYNISFYNLFEWHAQRYQAVRDDDSLYYTDANKGQLARYTREDFASTFRWDFKTLWTPSFAHGGSISLEVNNLLNKKM